MTLKRKVGQSIKIGDDIEVFIVAMKGNEVSVSITAPKALAIHRKELYEVMKNGDEPIRHSKPLQNNLSIARKFLNRNENPIRLQGVKCPACLTINQAKPTDRAIHCQQCQTLISLNDEKLD